MSTTVAVVRLLGNLLRDKTLGPRIVPIVADEARTFGMASLFRQVGIYSPVGQLYEPEDSGILWIKFNRPDRMNALVGTSEETGTVAKVGEYMRAGDDDPNIRVIVLTGVGRGFCSGANLSG